MIRKYKYIRDLEKEKENREKKEIKQKNESFLENTLKKADSEFENYIRGYRIFSVRNPEHSNSIEDYLLSDIANEIADKYKCELISISINESDEVFSRKTYLFTFKK